MNITLPNSPNPELWTIVVGSSTTTKWILGILFLLSIASAILACTYNDKYYDSYEEKYSDNSFTTQMSKNFAAIRVGLLPPIAFLLLFHSIIGHDYSGIAYKSLSEANQANQYYSAGFIHDQSYVKSFKYSSDNYKFYGIHHMNNVHNRVLNAKELMLVTNKLENNYSFTLADRNTPLPLVNTSNINNESFKNIRVNTRVNNDSYKCVASASNTKYNIVGDPLTVKISGVYCLEGNSIVLLPTK